MKFVPASFSAAALISFFTTVEAAGHAHNHYRLHPIREGENLQKRGGGQCQFPANEGLIPITPHEKNAGWAMSPNQPCRPGDYCPYACPEGQLSMQWDPHATSYSNPTSIKGGLYCDEDGNIQKPFPDKPYCQEGTGAVSAVNKCNSHVSFCQTVLPGNEAMLIPTLVTELATLAVPGADYWLSTAAHFYINPPGVDSNVACKWGSSSNPFGNWSPYVAGANTDKDGQTYLKLGWNPIYLQPSTPFRDTLPEFGVEIVCEGDGCNNLPCKIDPAVNGVNEITGSGSDGAGNGAFCVVTVPKGQKANVVVFERSKSGDSSSPVSSSSILSSTVDTTSLVTPTTNSVSTTSSSTTSATATTISSVQVSTTSTTSTSFSSYFSATSSTPTSSLVISATPSTSSPSSFSVSVAIPTSSSEHGRPIPTSSAYHPHMPLGLTGAGINSTASASNSSFSRPSPLSNGNVRNSAPASVLGLVSVFAATLMMEL